MEIGITKFSDVLTKSLEDNLRKKLDPRQSHINAIEAFGEAELERIMCADGWMNHPATAKQRQSGRRVGADVN